MIEFRQVTKAYPNNVVALSQVNLVIRKGEFVFVVGPSGAGKTTLTRLIYREELPTAGSVIFDGDDVTKLRTCDVPFLRRNIGVVFQDFKLLPDRNVFDNVAFALEVTGMSRREIRRRVPQALDAVGLKDKANAMPGQLSGGEQQRTALARAIINKPAVLIADEPTGNLDPTTSWGIVRLLEEINRWGTTVVMATHAQGIVNSMQKRVIAMSRGRVVRDDERGVYVNDAQQLGLRHT
ncbi:MAG: cell division ATP-binding protein FtsE [Firmicutes bacterium]|nr:cell division ATP-binding protein FtsE [Bacillota bacterium]